MIQQSNEADWNICRPPKMEVAGPQAAAAQHARIMTMENTSLGF